MKKTKALVLGMTLTMLLSGCNGGKNGGNENKAKTFNLTFHQANVEDTIYTVTQGVTKNSDIVEPEIVNQLEGYTYYWEYDVESMTADLTVEPSKSAIEYTATFVEEDGETVVATVPFTVEDTSLEEPVVPAKKGYSGEWEEYTLGASDITIEPDYTLQNYTVTFTINGEAYGSPQTFCVLDLDESNHLPATLFPEYSGLPQTLLDEHPYKDPKWNDPAIETMGDITIELGWVDHLYEVEFQNEDGEVIATKTYTYNGSQASNIEEPAVPEKTGYSGTWNYEPNASSQTIVVKPTYETVKYVATFVNAEGATVGTVEYTIETTSIADQEPTVPVIEGMDGEWEEYELTPGGITVRPTYVNHRYYIEYQVDGVTIEGGLIWYDKDTASYASLEKPAVPEKTGYTGTWNDAEVTLTNSDTHIIVNAVYTANVYKVTLPGGTEANITFDSDYDLSSYASYENQLYWEGQLVPLKGKYQIPSDIVLTYDKNRTAKEDFERVEALNGLIDFNKSTVKSIEVKDGVGVNGSRGIEVVWGGGDKGIYLTKEYLDTVFAKPEILALEFDAKGDTDAHNWRHRTYNMDASGKTGTGAKNVTYCNGSAGTGLSPYWQTFSFTRQWYDDLKSNPSFDGGFVMFGTPRGEGKVWIDNLRPALRDLKNNLEYCTDAWSGYTYHKDDYSQVVQNNWGTAGVHDLMIKDPFTGQLDITVFIDKVNETSGLNQFVSLGFDTKIKSDGLASLHIEKQKDSAGNSYMCFYLNNKTKVQSAIAAGYDGYEFDIMADHDCGTGNFMVYKDNMGDSAPLAGPSNLFAGKWIHMKVPFKNMRNSGVPTANQCGLFQITNGSDGKLVNNIWIDGIRPYKDEAPTGEYMVESFENSNVCKIMNYKSDGSLDSVYYESSKYGAYTDGVENSVCASSGKSYRDTGYSNFWFNTSLNADKTDSRCKASIDSLRAKHGIYSYRLDMLQGGAVWGFVRQQDLADVSAIKLWVYGDTAEEFNFGKKVTGGKHDGTMIQPNTWTLVTIERNMDINEDGTNVVEEDKNFARLMESELPAGSYWFDNITFVK